MNRAALFCAVLTLSLSFNSEAMAAEATAQSIVDLIQKSNALPGYKISARVDKDEATISTYRSAESPKEALDNDCKIDAAMFAKELMLNNNIGVRKVRVHFHEPTLTGMYREVIVTLPEVKAFSSGAVSREDFVASIILNRIPEQEKPVARPLPAPITTEAVVGSAGSQPKPPANQYTSRTGISFAVPNGWTVDDKLAGGGTLFKLMSRVTQQDNIQFKVMRTQRSPALLAQEKHNEFSYEGVSFERYERTRFGKGNYEGALIILTYPHTTHEPYYEMHLYFGQPPLVYHLYGWCAMSDARTVKPAFLDVMATLNFSGASGGAPSAKPGVTKPAASGKPASRHK